MFSGRQELYTSIWASTSLCVIIYTKQECIFYANRLHFKINLKDKKKRLQHDDQISDFLVIS